jgi:SUMO ligase MMS21 Smc5/6 complex component
MTIFDCTFVPIDVRNIPAFLSECILSITNYTNGLLFSSNATASLPIIIKKVILLFVYDILIKGAGENGKKEIQS